MAKKSRHKRGRGRPSKAPSTQDAAELRELENAVHDAERNNDLPSAEHRLERLTQRFPNHAATYLARAKLRHRQGDLDGALEDLERMARLAGIQSRRQDGDFLRGKLLDTKGRYAEAFAAFTQANNASLRSYPQLPAGNREMIKRVRNMGQHFSAPTCASWAGALPALPFTLVWHVGFPRSGTTLLDKVLASHPQVTVLEEEQTLGVLGSLLDQLPGGYPACLASMDAATAQKFRTIYLTQLQSIAGPLEAGRVYVDKMPINTIHLGLAARLLPDVRVLFSLRHPLDVVLSCFMQPLRLNPVNRCFVKLDDAVALYDATMMLYRHFQQVLALPNLTVRYESLVQDLEDSARTVCDFLGLPFDPAVLDFQERAKRERVATASYAQVIKPLYTQAIDRWQHYEESLSPWLPTMAPHCKYFSYALPSVASSPAAVVANANHQ